MTPTEFKTIRRALGLSAQRCARVLGIATGRTVRRWEAGSQDIPGPVLRLMRIMDWGVVQPNEIEDME